MATHKIDYNGSSTAIGAGIAECFVKEGANVSITGRNREKLNAVAKKCKEYGSDNVLTTVGDIPQEGVRGRLVQRTRETFNRIDILVNNAGRLLISPLNEVTEQHYNDLMDLHLKTPLMLTSLTAPHLIESKGYGKGQEATIGPPHNNVKAVGSSNTFQGNLQLVNRSLALWFENLGQDTRSPIYEITVMQKGFRLMTMSLRGKVAIITGSSTGIGAGIAECFIKEGANVSITGRNREKLDAVAKKCKEYGSGNVLTTVGDITQEGVRERLVRQTRETFGRIDILVNNAGMLLISPLSEVTEEHYSDVMDLNLKTPIMLTSLTAPHLIESKGCVINISSVASEVSAPGTGIYAITKAALDKYTKVLAQEMAPQGVRVNGISPGYIPTEILNRGTVSKEASDILLAVVVKATPVRRNGTPDEIGKAAVFLASDNASFVNGDILNADGGLRLTPGF